MYCLVEVNDLAKGISLAAEKARPGETYIFSGEPRRLREHFDIWRSKSGGFRVRVWLPDVPMALAFAALAPLERAAGLPAFMSRDTLLTAETNLYYSSLKAQQELGWTHCTAQEMWFNTIDSELELLRRRKKRDLVSRLNPVESDGLRTSLASEA
jgi:nucleoside-diphosphate-sugar epimerase